MQKAANTKKWRQILGDLGEALAQEYLEESGLRTLEQKYRAGRKGEVDLIMALLKTSHQQDHEEEWLVFVEVKTRLEVDEPANGQMAVDVIKQRKIQQAALFYLRNGKEMKSRCSKRRLRPRFDVVLVDFFCTREKLRELIAADDRVAMGALARITHVEEAFGAL